MADCVEKVGGLARQTPTVEERFPPRGFWNQDSRSAGSRNGILRNVAEVLTRRVFQQNRHFADIVPASLHVGFRRQSGPRARVHRSNLGVALRELTRSTTSPLLPLSVAAENRSNKHWPAGSVTLTTIDRTTSHQAFRSGDESHSTPCVRRITAELTKSAAGDEMTLNVEGVVDGGVN